MGGLSRLKKTASSINKKRKQATSKVTSPVGRAASSINRERKLRYSSINRERQRHLSSLNAERKRTKAKLTAEAKRNASNVNAARKPMANVAIKAHRETVIEPYKKGLEAAKKANRWQRDNVRRPLAESMGLGASDQPAVQGVPATPGDQEAWTPTFGDPGSTSGAGGPGMGGPGTYGSRYRDPNQTSPLVSEQMHKLLASSSPYIQRARQRAKQYANRKGLLSSSIAAGAGETAAIDAALPIATQDAQFASGLETLREDLGNRYRINKALQDDRLLAEVGLSDAPTATKDAVMDIIYGGGGAGVGGSTPSPRPLPSSSSNVGRKVGANRSGSKFRKPPVPTMSPRAPSPPSKSRSSTYIGQPVSRGGSRFKKPPVPTMSPRPSASSPKPRPGMMKSQPFRSHPGSSGFQNKGFGGFRGFR